MTVKKSNHIRVIDLPFHENTAVRFNDTGMIISTGINVSAAIAATLSFNTDIFKGKVYKGECMQIYKHEKHIPCGFINRATVLNVQKELLLMCQNDVNLIKEKV